MATHVHSDIQPGLPARAPVPVARYDVGARCRMIALSIIMLLALFVLVAIL